MHGREPRRTRGETARPSRAGSSGSTPNRRAVHGPGARRIGTVEPVHGVTACWWALKRDGGIQGRGASFGAAVGLVVDAAVEARSGA